MVTQVPAKALPQKSYCLKEWFLLRALFQIKIYYQNSKIKYHHNHHYYVLDNATISDYDFDIKLKELEALEAAHPEFYDANSPSQRVGGSITKNFQTLLHKNRMYSLDNSYSKEDLLDWEKRLQKNLGTEVIEYTCELKYDGASINLTYENGEFLKAVTRGDGFQGDDVTNNIKTIKCCINSGGA